MIKGKSIEIAAKLIKKGGVIVYPTETVYGLGALAFREDAVRRIYDLKRRTQTKPISIAVSSIEMIHRIAKLDEKSLDFIRRFLPGPVTVLLQKKEVVPDFLTAGERLIGVRYPKHDISLKLIGLVGEPITSTSANISGEPPPRSPEEVRVEADYLLDGGPCTYGEPSTIVDLADWRIVRKGARWEEILGNL